MSTFHSRRHEKRPMAEVYESSDKFLNTLCELPPDTASATHSSLLSLIYQTKFIRLRLRQLQLLPYTVSKLSMQIATYYSFYLARGSEHPTYNAM